ncbi:MAG: hypothetical protein NTX50_00190 [Candidatus Sumerlaeota bacterium]|nr:hypothetical protein [Candidatus Sumerlaeota bacterium]
MDETTDPETANPCHPALDQAAIDALLRRVQDLEDTVEELIEIALVNRAGLLTALAKGVYTREELRKAYDRIEIAHERAVEQGEEYCILPGAAAYFLENGA